MTPTFTAITRNAPRLVHDVSRCHPKEPQAHYALGARRLGGWGVGGQGNRPVALMRIPNNVKRCLLIYPIYLVLADSTVVA